MTQDSESSLSILSPEKRDAGNFQNVHMKNRIGDLILLISSATLSLFIGTKLATGRNQKKHAVSDPQVTFIWVGKGHLVQKEHRQKSLK